MSVRHLLGLAAWPRASVEPLPPPVDIRYGYLVIFHGSYYLGGRKLVPRRWHCRPARSNPDPASGGTPMADEDDIRALLKVYESAADPVPPRRRAVARCHDVAP